MLTFDYQALQYCPECETTLTKPEGHNPLPPQFRIMLRVTLPSLEDDDATTVASTAEEETDQQKLMHQISGVDARLQNLEGRFGTITDKMQSLDDKMDKILGILSAFASLPVFASSTGTGTALVSASEVPAPGETPAVPLPTQG